MAAKSSKPAVTVGKTADDTEVTRAGGPQDVDKEGRRKPEDELKEGDQVKAWASRITQAETENEDWFTKDLKRLRGYVTGEQHNDGQPGLVRTNLIWSTISTNLPHIYARDPQIEVSLTDAVPKEQYQVYKAFGKSLQSVMESLFVRGGKLKLRAKSNVRAAMTTSIGWCKVIYQQDVRKDPIVQGRINDTQDNIQRVLTLIQQIEKGESTGDTGELESKKLELQEQMKALASDVEVATAHGIVIDRVLTEDLLILDASIKDFDYYVEADAIAHRFWVTKDKYQDLFGYALPEGATPYDRPESKPAENAKPTTTPVGGVKPPVYYACYEIWHKGANTVYTLVKGAKTWTRAPYQPENVGERWYPFFGLAFNPVDGRWRPMSDVELLTELQDEYNTTRTNFAEARKSSIPVLIVRKGGDLTEQDIENIKNRKINQIIAVEGTPGKPIANEIAFLPTAVLDPKVYDTSQIRSDFEMVSGTADAARGNIEKVKTATEADILQQGLMSRTDERRDVMEDWVQAMAQYSAEILLEVLTRPQVARLVGEEAAQGWPQLSRDRIFEMVELRIRAGSAGKPNEQKERENWLQLLPIIQQTITQVFQLQASGGTALAKASLELLGETMQRFDEYIDLDKFIPPEMRDGSDGADQTGQMMQQLVQLQQQVQQLTEQAQKDQEDLQAAQQAASLAQQGQQLKMQQSQEAAQLESQKQAAADARAARELDAKRAEQRSKNNQDALNLARTLTFNEDLEKLRLASAERIEVMKLRLQDDHEKRKLDAQQKQADASLKSNEDQGAAALASSEKLAKQKNQSTEKVAGGKDKTTVATAKLGQAAKTAAGESEAAPASADQVLSKLADAIDNLAAATAGDRVPERNPKTGLIDRVKIVPKPTAKPKAKAKA